MALAPPSEEEVRRRLGRTFEVMATMQGNTILVSRRQEGNPMLRYVRNVRWQFADIVPDFLLGNGIAALFISLRYHLLKPEYLYARIRELRNSFKLRVVLCHVDVEEVSKPLGEVNVLCAKCNCSLVCAWSGEEVARYLETFKLYENKTAESIQERTDADYLSRLTGALTSIRGVNRTDCVTLGSEFGSLAQLMLASPQQLAACSGIGPTKARRLHEAFHEPLRGKAGGAAGGGAQASITQFVTGGAGRGGAAAAAAAAGPAVPEAEEAEEEEEEEEGEEGGGDRGQDLPLYTQAEADAEDLEHRSVLD